MYIDGPYRLDFRTNRCSVKHMPPTTAQGFEWVPEELDKLFRRNGFQDFSDFIARREGAEESRSVLYHSRKTGDVSMRVMQVLAEQLGADFGKLIRLKSSVLKTGRKRAPIKKTQRKGAGDDNH